MGTMSSNRQNMENRIRDEFDMIKSDQESDDGSQIVDNKKMNDMIENARKLEMDRKNKS